MKLHYQLYKAKDGGYVAALLECNVIISGNTKEEIEIEINNAIDGYIIAFGEHNFYEWTDFELKELEYNLDERRKRIKK